MDATTPTSTFGTSSNTVLSAGSSRDALTSDFDTFLQMLTVQVENQDPLNPVDATDYATQLATFSAVEQQIKTNELLEVISNQSGTGALQTYGGWIGMEALVVAPAQFEGAPIALRPEYNAGADRADLVVKNAAGEIVDRRDATAGNTHISWDGQSESGQSFASGAYSFSIESFKEDELIDTQAVPAYSRVDEIRTLGNSAVLRLSDGSELAATAVQGLRNPADQS